MESNSYVEVRNGGYYVAGSRIGLDVIYHAFERGRSPESIFSAYPSVGTLAKVYGAIAYLLEHPEEIRAYLADQQRLFHEMQDRFPMPAEMLERVERVRRERAEKSA